MIEWLGSDGFFHRFHSRFIRVDFRLDAVENLHAFLLAIVARLLDEATVFAQLLMAHADSGLGKAALRHGDVAGERDQADSPIRCRINIVRRLPDSMSAQVGMHVAIKAFMGSGLFVVVCFNHGQS